jgi:hypothetical protein
MSKSLKLRSAADVIDLLGGEIELARRLKVGRSAVANWRLRGLPPDTYHALTILLDQKGVSAPPSLWRQREIAK